jgi:adenylate cyclase
MSAESFKRKLTAILSADVKGYSRLMGENEAETVKTLTAYRKIMGELIQQHRGRVIDSPGDNILAEFASVVDAVQCAVAAQNEFKARNAELPENRRMEFRVGVNLGDVIEEENRIYGDGVNIAARLESLADPGGICISKTAFDQIETKLPLGYEYLGDQTVKNIAKPVGAYRVLMDPRVTVAGAKYKKTPVPVWPRKRVLAGAVAVLILIIGVAVWNFYWRTPKIEPASKEKMAFPLPDKASIAVLPFVNMSGDPKDEYLSDGLTEQIITSLSRIDKMLVIARNSAFVYKGKPVKVQKVAEELGVRYVIEGSVQKSGDKVRITAQLIDALTGRHIWSEKYDRELKDIFALQDEITMKIVGGTRVELTEGEQARVWMKKGSTKNMQAFEKNMQGLVFMRRSTKQDNVTARGFFEEAIAIDADYVWPIVNLGLTHMWDARAGWSESPAKSLQTAYELAQKSLAMDDSNDIGHSLLASIYAIKRQYDKALPEAERAVALNPNGSEAYYFLGGIVGASGNWAESVPHIKMSIRLNPIPTASKYCYLGRSYFMLGQYDEAVVELKKALQTDPDFIMAHIFLAACYSSMGRDAEAASAAKEVLRINPKFSVESHAKTLPYKDKADVDREVAALRKAGLK